VTGSFKSLKIAKKDGLISDLRFRCEHIFASDIVFADDKVGGNGITFL
jgi:hypothetical protein